MLGQLIQISGAKKIAYIQPLLKCSTADLKVWGMAVRRMFIGQGGGERKRGGGMAQREQKAVLADFRRGAFNTLVASCVGEEGLDIPQVTLLSAENPTVVDLSMTHVGPHECYGTFPMCSAGR
jgi:hypothetical protein